MTRRNAPKPSPRAPAARTPSRTIFSPAESAFLASVVADGIQIQPRFRPEPMLALTGRGFMKSTGASEIAAAKKPSRPFR